MSERESELCFEGDAFLVQAGDHVGRIRRGVYGSGDLFSALSAALRFPDYFGHNWDAVWECICDRSWIPNHRVVIINSDLPRLTDRDLMTYFEILRDAIRDWRNETHETEPTHELCVVFHPEYEAIYEAIIAKCR